MNSAGRVVRVAAARIRDWQAQAPALEATLSADERARVGRLHFERDRVARVIAYGVHRAVLAEALAVSSAAVPLYRDALGRPRIEGDAVWTSLSHTKGWVIVAIDAQSPVGIDVEPVSRALAVEEVSASVLHPDELGRVAAVDEGLRARTLLALWVGKEAVLKAAGVGLRIPMCSFPLQPSSLVRVTGSVEEWQVRSVEVDVSVEVALAVVGTPAVSCSVIRPSPGADAGIAYTSRS